MSKRGAETYLINPKDGTSQQAPGNPENKSQMATAAQLAKRKIIDPKARRRPGTPSGSSFASPSTNPFGNLNGAQQQQPQTFGGFGGVTFGASQSFPPGIATPGADFNFQAPTSFSFGQGNQTPTSNPFSNANASGNSSQSNAQSEDAMMESPQKKPAFGGFSFGANNNDTSAAAPPAFGQSQQNGLFNFGASAPKPDSFSQSSGLFGRISTAEEPTSQPSASMFSFGQSQTTPSASTNIFGSTHSLAALPAPSNSFSIGQTSTSQESSKPSDQLQSQSFTFGQSQPASQSNIFGGFKTSKTEDPQPPQPSNTFGDFDFSKPTDSKASTSLFGAAITSSQPMPSIFGQSTPALASTSNLFGQERTSQSITDPLPAVSAPQNANPFGGLFGQSLPSGPRQRESSPASAPVKPVFNFSSTTQPPSNPFASITQPNRAVSPEQQYSKFLEPGNGFGTSSAEDDAPRPTAKPANSFGFTPSQTQAEDSSGGLVGKTKPAEINGSKTADLFNQFSRAEQNSQGSASWQSNKSDELARSSPSLFGSIVDSKKPNQTDVSSEKAPIWGGGQLFNPQPQTESSLQSPVKEPSDRIGFNKTSSELFKPQTPRPAAQAIRADENNKAPGTPSTCFDNTLQSTPTIAKTLTTTPAPDALFENARTATSSAAVFQSAVDPNELVKANVKVRSRTSGPGSVPKFFDNDRRVEHDKTYRLTSLDYGFAQQVASLDSKKQDISLLVRSYIAARESIGQPIGGLYMRAMAGSKRKADDGIEGHEEVPTQPKKSKADNSNSAVGLFGSTSTSAVPTSQASSNTSSLFQDMISTPTTNAKQPTVAPASAPPKSVFASVQPMQAAEATGGFKPFGYQTVTGASSSSSSNVFEGFGSAKTPTPVTSSTTSIGFTPTMSSTTPIKSPPKKSTFEVPKFGGGASTNFMASFAKQAGTNVAKEKAKRKAEEYDSDEETEEEYEARKSKEEGEKLTTFANIIKTGFKPVLGNTETETVSKPTTSPSKASTQDKISKKPSAVAPLPSSTAFGGFGQPARSSAFTFGSAKSSDEPTESDDQQSQSQGDEDDDEEQHDDNYDPEDENAEEQSDNSEEADESEEHVGDGDDEDSSADHQASFQVSQENKGKSLFDRITPPKQSIRSSPTNGATSGQRSNGFSSNIFDSGSGSEDAPILQSAPNNSFKGFPIGSDIFQSTPKAPAISPFTPTNGLEVPKKPTELSKTFNFTPTPPTSAPTPVAGASVLFGGLTRGGNIPGEGLFGSRPSTPNNTESTTNVADATASIFSNQATSSNSSTMKNDNTWKLGGPINFGTPEKTSDAPAVNITTATPPAKDENATPRPFSSLFGANAFTNSTPASGSAGHLGFNFGTPAPGFLGASSHLLPSANSSAVSSRATSPGATDNESVATNDSEDIANDPQTSLMTSRSGEEGEEVLYEGRAKALKWFDEDMAAGKPGMNAKEYNTMGLGEVRILKNNDTGKTRILFRAEPSSKIVINTNLVERVSYASVPGKTGSVKFGILTKERIEKWVLKVKTVEMAQQLATIMEENKA